jgi:hypothetical protein
MARRSERSFACVPGSPTVRRKHMTSFLSFEFLIPSGFTGDGPIIIIGG